MSHTVVINWDTYAVVWTEIERIAGHELYSSEFRTYVSQNKLYQITPLILKTTERTYQVDFETEEQLIEFKLKYL